MWSNSSRCIICFDLLVPNVMHIFMIIALDIVIVMRFSINCSTVICLPSVCYNFKREASSETYVHRVYFRPYIFRSINHKILKYLAAIYLYLLYFAFYLSLYLSLLDLTLASDREGIGSPFSH